MIISATLLLLVNEVLYLDLSCRSRSAPASHPRMIVISENILVNQGVGSSYIDAPFSTRILKFDAKLVLTICRPSSYTEIPIKVE